jgi:hypothetical protein
VPLPVVRPLLRGFELAGAAVATERGTADAESLGVSPLPMREVLAAS